MSRAACAIICRRLTAEPPLSKRPCTPPLSQRCVDGNPRGAFLSGSSAQPADLHLSPISHAIEFCPGASVSTSLTKAPQLESSYEATTRVQLDLVLRQQGSFVIFSM